MTVSPMRCKLRPLMSLALTSLAVLALVSCDDMRTASGDFGVSLADFTRLPGTGPYVALEGSSLCEPEPRCGPCDGDAPICESVSMAVSGAEVDASGCYPLTAGGALSFEFTPEGCTSAAPSESLTVSALPVSAVRARLVPEWILAEDLGPSLDWEPFTLVSQGATLATPDSFATLQLLADLEAKVQTRLHEASSGRRVGWSPSQGALSFTAQSGLTPTAGGDAENVTLAAAAGDRADAALVLAGSELPLGEVVGVTADTIDRIEVTALFFDGGADGQQPIQAQAQAKTADGGVVVGVPITWRVVEGDLVLRASEEEPLAATIELTECLPRRPQETRRGAIEASFGEISGRLDLSWRGYTGAQPAYEVECEREGCGCQSGASGAGWMGLGVMLLGLARRRRSRFFYHNAGVPCAVVGPLGRSEARPRVLG